MPKISRHGRAIEVLPSESNIEGLFWIVSDKSLLGLRSSSHGEDMEKAGKWLIFVSTDKADEIWTKLVRACEDGKIHGVGMKISSLFNMRIQGYG